MALKYFSVGLIQINSNFLGLVTRPVGSRSAPPSPIMAPQVCCAAELKERPERESLTGEKRPVGGVIPDRPIRALLRDTVVTCPTTGTPVLGWGSQGARRRSVVRLLNLDFLPAAAVAICGATT